MLTKIARRLEDLRFSIGAFFVIVGALLIFAGLFPENPQENSSLNLITGGGLVLFGALGLFASFRAARLTTPNERDDKL